MQLPDASTGMVCGVERAHDLGELRVAAREAHGGSLGRGGHGFAEAREDILHLSELVGVGGDCLHAWTADLGLERRGSALRDDAPVVDDPHAIGEHVGLFEVLGGEEHGDPAVAGEALDLLPERAAALDVEPGGGLVQEQDARPVHERQREVEPALHPTRIAADPAVRAWIRPTRSSSVSERSRRCLPAHSMERGLEPHVLAPGQKWVEGGLLERRADGGADRRALLDHVVAGHARRARCGRQQRGEHMHGRRLAGAVGAEEAVDLARLHAQVDAVHRTRALLELAY